MNELQAGEVADPYNVDSILTAIRRLYVAWRQGKEQVADAKALNMFDRREVGDLLPNVWTCWWPPSRATGNRAVRLTSRRCAQGITFGHAPLLTVCLC